MLVYFKWCRPGWVEVWERAIANGYTQQEQQMHLSNHKHKTFFVILLLLRLLNSLIVRSLALLLVIYVYEDKSTKLTFGCSQITTIVPNAALWEHAVRLKTPNYMDGHRGLHLMGSSLMAGHKPESNWVFWRISNSFYLGIGLLFKCFEKRNFNVQVLFFNKHYLLIISIIFH